jgi:pimeloyl-ACP methyl ester carboxylesterase
VLPTLERAYDVLAPTLPGHAGGPSVDGPIGVEDAVDILEQTMDDAGFATARIVGNSLGGFLALQLAARGRADAVVALSPAGCWAEDDPLFGAELVSRFTAMQELARAAAPHIDAIVDTPDGRRQVTEYITSHSEHLSAELVAHLVLGVGSCDDVGPIMERALRDGWQLDAERIDCPVRVVWGTGDLVLPWPSAAARLRTWVPQAEWIELDGAGHCPQLDVPLEIAALIMEGDALRGSSASRP